MRLKRPFHLKWLPALVLAAVLIAACAGAPAVEPGGGLQASPTAGEPEAAPTPTPTRPTAEDTLTAPALQPIEVTHAGVETGTGSPIPVEVAVSGQWPQLCSQLAQIEQRIQGSRIEISLLASPAEPDCPPDFVGLSFGMEIPLNMVEMPEGTYTVAVNGFETTFDWAAAGEVQAEAAPEGEPLPVPVEALAVEIGVGSPIPVRALASGTWPGLCAQLARIEQRMQGSRFEFTLLAAPGDPNCPPDQLGLPFHIALPLNMVELEFGEYTAVVNGVETRFTWEAQPGLWGDGTETTAEPGAGETPGGEAGAAVPFVWRDGNLWLLEGAGGQPRQLTGDAVSFGRGAENPQEILEYASPALSSDGRLLAYQRTTGRVTPERLVSETGLWVMDLASGESRQVLAEDPAGFAWRPGTHTLAYGRIADMAYFASRGQTEPSLAQGIWALDADQPSPEPFELAPPERGYHLVSPVWSPDGRFLAFDELLYMEGRGPFAYFDVENGEYSAWEDAIGGFSFSPDGERLAYDRLTYAPSGEERIYLRERLGGEERQLSPQAAEGYAFSPVFSPQGDRLAYLAVPGGQESQRYTLTVLDLAGGEPRALGEFESVLNLTWTPAGLAFTAGPYLEETFFLVSPEDGAVLVEY